jgi:hypothetical protein
MCRLLSSVYGNMQEQRSKYFGKAAYKIYFPGLSHAYHICSYDKDGAFKGRHLISRIAYDMRHDAFGNALNAVCMGRRKTHLS